jgi:iron-sulfur cluster repair protein YtfE (RIC family)
MNVFDLFDKSQRPKAPPIPGATELHRSAGRRLAEIHEMHLLALEETKSMMDQVQHGEDNAKNLAEHVASLELFENYRRFGNLCGRECQFLDFHHTSEDNEIFPAIALNGSEGLRRVIARLSEEHSVIHKLLEALAMNVTDLWADPSATNFARTRETYQDLYKAVRSHFSYEQAELEEAIGYYGVL